VAVVLTLVQTKQIRINTHKRNNIKNTVQTIQNTRNTNIGITKTPTLHKTPTYTHPHITNKLKQTHYKIHPNKIVTIQPSTLSIRSPLCTWHFYLQKLHCNSFHFTLLQNKITSYKSRQFTPHHLFTLNPHSNSLACNYILNPLFKCVQFTGERC
jgi:GTPase Era involved in 16S rRNA processing